MAPNKKRAREEDEAEVMAIMAWVEDVFCNSIFSSDKVPQEIRRSTRTSSYTAQAIEWSEKTVCTINRLSVEITCESSKGVDIVTITESILDSLEHFSWVMKMVIVLAAFATSYGEFWRANISPVDDQLSKSLFKMKKARYSYDSTIASKFLFEKQAIWIKSMLDSVHQLIELKGYSEQFKSESEVEAVCRQTIRSVLSCQSCNMEFVKKGQYTESAIEIHEREPTELRSFNTILYEKVEKISIIEEEKAFLTSYKDVTILIKKFFTEQDDMILWRCTENQDSLKAVKGQNALDALKGRSVALFISDYNFDTGLEEYKRLVETYEKIKQGKNKDEFEIVWIPMVDESGQRVEINEIHKRAKKMPWYTFCDTKAIRTSFKNYIKEKWYFQKKPILVVMDSKGNVTSTDAISMVTVWREKAYPFSKLKEAAMWREITWNVGTLLDGVTGIETSSLTNEGKLVCLYGGENLDWLKKFATKMTSVRDGTGVLIDVIYMGFNGRREKQRTIRNAIEQEGIGACWQEDTVYSFWSHFQCMYNSLIKHCKSPAFKSTILKELMEILSYSSTPPEYGWAIMFTGSQNIVIASTKQLTQLLENFQTWKENVHSPADFLKVVGDDKKTKRSEVHCIHTTIPMAGWLDPGERSCLECGNAMERYYHYECCIEPKGSTVYGSVQES